MILVTGASGKTGQHIVQALANCQQIVRAFVHKSEQVETLRKLGAKDVQVGDMHDLRSLRTAFAGVTTVYHIAPNMCPDELSIGQVVIAAASEAGIQHFVYHSVLHPQVVDMPHHWLKSRVEEEIFKSGLRYTILQPTAYMQNLLGYRTAILERGVYAVPYLIDSRQSLVDLNDVAEAAALVLTQPGHEYAIYELASEDAPSPREISQMLSKQLGKLVQAEHTDRRIWEAQSRANGMSDYSVTTLLKMFTYYEKHHFYGNPNVLTWLLGKKPNRFKTFLDCEIKTWRGVN